MLTPLVRRIIAGVLIAVVAGAGAWLLMTWEGGERRAPAEEREPGRPAVAIMQSELEHTRGGHPAWWLSIEEIEISGGGRAVAASGLREGLVYDEGRPVVRISAGRATYRARDKSFEVTGGVKVVSDKGAIVTTGKVQWLPATQTLHCPGEVTMRAEGVTVRAENLDLIVPENVARTAGRVQLRTEHGQLTGRNLQYDLDTHAYTLQSIQAVFTIDEAREELGRLR